MLKRQLQQRDTNTNIYRNLSYNQNYNQNYNRSSNQNTVNRNRRIKFKHPPKYYLKRARNILAIFIVFLLLYQIPFIKNICNKMYEGNFLIKILIDSFVTTFKSTF